MQLIEFLGWRVEQRYLERRRDAGDRVIALVVVDAGVLPPALQPALAVRQLHADPNRMGTRHVRERRHGCAADGRVHVERRVRRAPRLTVRRIHFRDRITGRGREAVLESGLQLARRVRLVVDGPLRLGHVVLLRLARAEGVLRPDRAGPGHAVLLVTAELDDAIEVEAELVLRAHLPREARHEALDQVVVDGLVRQIGVEGDIVRRERRRAVERVRKRLIDAPVPHRSEEPHFVHLERSASGDVQVVNAHQ